MTRKVNSKKDLPKSFDLGKYDCLENLSDKDLFRQLYWRQDDLTMKHSEMPEYGFMFGAEYPLHNNYGDPFGELKEDDWFCDKQKEYDHKVQPKLIELSYDDGIKPVTRFDISMINKLTAERGYWKDKPIIIDNEMVGSLISEDNGMFWAVMREPVNLLSDTLDNMLVSVDLLHNRDDELIEAFTKLLPKWRSELSIVEPDKPIAGSWESIRRKIIDYKIIPLIDLLSWELSTDRKISLGVLAVSLYPDGEKDTFAIAQTVKPFLEKIMRSDSLEKIRKILSNEN
ncbi:TPA: DUF6387 family protein [Shigella sonnei]|nr:hypothetical protein [Shigella sonnei]HAK0060963.1 hypothetical protein [Shigella sonnei]HCH9071717.1 hypothetical protein [Shigella sonnei]HCH9171218.1 hypothetical protein [Shigella sonnei]